MMADPDDSPVRPLQPTVLTGLFLPSGAPPPVGVALPSAPVPNWTLRLPAGGVTLLYGTDAAGLMGAAMRRAQRQSHYCVGARVYPAFARVQPANRPLTPERLAAVELLWLDKLYTGPDLARRVQQHVLRYLDAEGRAVAPQPPARFAEIGRHPDLLERLLREPEFAHLRAVVLLLPGIEAKDGNRRSAKVMYVRDPALIRRIQVDYGAPGDREVFRWPTAEELASPPALWNPFAATLPKPSVVYVRWGPVGPVG